MTSFGRECARTCRTDVIAEIDTVAYRDTGPIQASSNSRLMSSPMVRQTGARSRTWRRHVRSPIGVTAQLSVGEQIVDPVIHEVWDERNVEIPGKGE